MSRSDQELWSEILEGSESAWAIVVKRYQPLIYTICIRAGLSVADAADCFQQTWVRLYENRQQLKDPSRLSAWLVTTCKRESLRLRRQADRHSGDPSESQQVDPGPLPDEQLTALENQMHLELAIRELPQRCRRVIELFFYSPRKLKYEEIALILGLSANTLGALRRRCLKRIAEILRRSGFLPERNEGS